jgi:hypothetical protein
MLCLDCGAEMRLVQVTKNTAMLVSGYEHHTWQCSECSTVEQRMTFNCKSSPTRPVSVESAPTNLAEPTDTVPAQPTQIVPVEPSVEAAQTVSVDQTKIASVEQHSAVVPKMTARAQALDEKLRDLKERARAAREAAGEIMKPTQCVRDWDNKSGSLAPRPTASEASSLKSDEPLPSSAEPIVPPAEISHDEPIAPLSTAPVATKFRERLGELVRAMRRKELANAR